MSIDGLLGYLYDRKMAMPMNETSQPKPHSDKWIEAKRNKVLKFMAMHFYYEAQETLSSNAKNN